jgi:hypothetical protein
VIRMAVLIAPTATSRFRARLREYALSFSVGCVRSREKNFLDSTIERYLYLADDELMALSPRIHGVGYYQSENAAINDLAGAHTHEAELHLSTNEKR